MRRLAAAISAVLLVLLAIAIAEASLAAMLFVFSTVLRVDLSLEFGQRLVQMYLLSHGPLAALQVAIHNAGTIGSILFTAAVGLTASALRFRRWRPAS